MKRKIQTMGPTETFYSNLRQANSTSLEHENFNNIPSKVLLRKMLHEVINDELLDRDIFKEVEIVNETIEDIIPGVVSSIMPKSRLT